MSARPEEEFCVLKRSSDYYVHYDSTISTTDNEDHAYFGIMFDVEVKKEIPLEHLQLDSFWVRGDLGNISVYVADQSHKEIYSEEDEWRQIYHQTHKGSFEDYVQLQLPKPLVITPGKRVALYLHSNNCCEGVVYDDQRSPVTFENSFIKVYSGLACTSPNPFGPYSDQASSWDWPWRPNREFVGRISFGVRYLLWRPIREVHCQYSEKFRKGIEETVKCLTSGRMGLRIYKDILNYLLNFLPFDWFEKDGDGVDLGDQKERIEKEPIGWGGDWTIYRRTLLEHMIQYQQRKGALSSPPLKSSGYLDMDIFEDDEDEVYEDVDECYSSDESICKSKRKKHV